MPTMHFDDPFADFLFAKFYTGLAWQNMVDGPKNAVRAPDMGANFLCCLQDFSQEHLFPSSRNFAYFPAKIFQTLNIYRDLTKLAVESARVQR